MAAPSLNDAISIRDVLSATVDSTTGTITYQTGVGVKSKQSVAQSAEVWSVPGVLAIPPNIASGAQDAPQGLFLNRGDRDICFAQRHVTTQTLAGNLGPGDTCIFAAGADATGQPRILLKGSDNTINIFTNKGNTADGTTLGAFIDGDADTITITNSKGHGFLIDENGVSIFTPKCSILLDASGDITIAATAQAQLDGGNIVIGSTVVPLVNAALVGPAYISSKPSAKTVIE
jgi:hypothetical protein